MPNPNMRGRWDMSQDEIAAVCADEREDALFDAVVTAASLVASADGHVVPAERKLVIDFLSDQGFLSTFTRAEILEAFDRRVREYETDGAAKTVAESLGRFAGHASARLIVDAGERVAVADGRLSPRELHMLWLIRVALAAPDARQRGG
ncbi:MAG: TerB family tellurite resistance protein [Methylovirgula sp.]